MGNKETLYCYTMTHDTGFAPNPYHGVLTLATCKPMVRKYAQKGYWISGWTGNAVYNKQGEIDKKGAGRLIYLAQVSKVISFKEYWENYPQKKQPTKSIEGGKECFKSCGNVLITKSDDISFCGDNIYEPCNNGFEQHKNPHHDKQNIERDLSGENVLICEEFYYFGVENAKDIKGITRIPRWKKYVSEKASEIIQQVTTKFKPGLYPQAL